MTTVGRCPTPALAAVRLGGSPGGLRPCPAPTRKALAAPVASRVRLRPALRPVPPCGRTAAYGLPLTRHPLNTTPNALKRPTARFLANPARMYPEARKTAPRASCGRSCASLPLLFHCQAIAGVPAWPFRPRKGHSHRGAGGGTPVVERPRRGL